MELVGGDVGDAIPSMLSLYSVNLQYFLNIRQFLQYFRTIRQILQQFYTRCKLFRFDIQRKGGKVIIIIIITNLYTVGKNVVQNRLI